MTEPYEFSALEAVSRIKSGALTSEILVRSCLERIAQRDGEVKAWTHLEHGEVIEKAIKSDESGNKGLLGGLPIGVKDIMNTSDMPTRYGSAIYSSNQPDCNAVCVNQMFRQGGIIMGKTVTTEFAWRNPGKTCNPNNLLHTPGGSSSGSAAAVSDYQIPLAFGTQTAGSVIRPAAYCGVVGFKPSIGTHDKTGVKELSGYLDTVGTMARSVVDVAMFDFALRTKHSPNLSIFNDRPLTFGRMLPFQDEVTEYALAVYDQACESLEKAGAKIIDVPVTANFERLAEFHTVIMTGDAGRALKWEYENHSDLLIRFYRENIMTGLTMDEEALEAVKIETDKARVTQGELFRTVDFILTVPASGEAPKGLSFTGDPIFNRVWTLLGWPCITIPWGRGPNNLPLGLQMVGAKREDAQLLAAAAWAENILD